MAEGVIELCGVSSRRTVIPLVKMPPSWPNHLPKVLVSNIIILVLKISRWEFWEGKNIYLKNNFFNVCLCFWDKERQSMSMGGGHRERETQNLKQAPGSEVSAQSPLWGLNSQTCLNSQTVRSWPELNPRINWLSHPGAPERTQTFRG